MVIYSFKGIRGAFYVGQIAGQLFCRVEERPHWLNLDRSGTISAHIVQSAHLTGPNQSSKVVYQVLHTRSNRIRLRTLGLAKL